MVEPLSIPKFLGLWLPALAVTASVPPPAPVLGQMFFIDIAGVPVPFVTCALAALGMGLSRPFALKAEADLGWPLFLLVSAIMLIVVQLWIIQSRPSWLFAFVVSAGMGFSGYSLLELMGEQVKDFVREVFAKARSTIGSGPKDDKQ